MWKDCDGCAAVAAVMRDDVFDDDVFEDAAADAFVADLAAACPAMAPASTSIPTTLAAPAVRRALRAG